MESSVKPALAGIVFDFNGTLVWDNRFHEEAWIIFAEQFGHTIDHDSYYRKIHGNTTANIFSDLLGHAAAKEEISHLSREKERLYRDICRQHPDTFVLAPGVEHLLDELKAKDVSMNIATASEIENVEFFITYFHLEKWFETEKIVYDDGKIPNKPEPDIYLHALTKMGLAPDSVAIIEDSVAGVRAAQASGCRYVIVTGEKTEQHQVFESMEGIAQVISDFSEIDRTLFI